MLVKKLAVAAASAALVLGAMAPMAFADVNVSNAGVVTVDSSTVANSGNNSVVASDDSSIGGGEDAGSVSIGTGVSSASNVVGTELNHNTVSVTGDGNTEAAEVNVHNCGLVAVDVATTSDTGNNLVSANDDSSVGNTTVTTGAASAGSNIQSVVNVNTVTVSTSGEEL